MDIVISYCEEWQSPLVTSKHHYARGLAKEGNKVLYLEYPVSILYLLINPVYFFKKVTGKGFLKPHQIEKNIWIFQSINIFPLHKIPFIFDNVLINELNQKFIFLFLNRALKKLNFKKSYLIIYWPNIFPILNKINPKRVLFHMIDEWEEVETIPLTLKDLISNVLRRADIVVVSSLPLLEKYRNKTKKIELLRHGIERNLFKDQRKRSISLSPHLKKYPRPVIGYYGSLSKLNFNLIKTVSNSRKDWTFIFIGPVKGPQGLKVKVELPANCEIWPPWKKEQLPSFLNFIDVFWMPFQNNQLTNFMSPIKLYEVMSTGKPIVSEDLVELRSAGGKLNLYADSFQTHIDYLQYQIDNDSVEEGDKRIDYVSAFSWRNRLESFREFLLKD